MKKELMGSSSYILSSSREYSLYVCQHRSIPAIEDGLKTGQRIALWLLRNKDQKIKTVALGGEMAASKLYVHGDASANNSISFLAAPYKNNVPLIEGHGSFGSRVAPSEIGAPRYTDVKRAKSAQRILYRDTDIVPMMENYDGSNLQPIHFLPLIPLVLLNGVEGIAVGWSTSIMPHRYTDIVDACVASLEGKKRKPLVPHYEGYDVDVKEIGNQQYEITGKVKIIDTSTLCITELPPGMNVEKFLKSLDQMEDDGKIVEFTDRSADSIDILVKFKRGSIAKWTPQQAIDYLKIKEKVTQRIVVVDFGGNTIAVYDNADVVVDRFVNWRLGWYRVRYEKMLKDDSDELVYWELLKLLFQKGFTKKLGTFPNRSSMEDEVREIARKAKMTLGDHHVDRAVRLPTYQWTSDFEANVGEKIVSLKSNIAEYNAILSDDKKIKAIYIDELKDVKKL